MGIDKANHVIQCMHVVRNNSKDLRMTALNQGDKGIIKQA